MSKEFGEQLDREYKEYKDWRNGTPRPLEPLEPKPFDLNKEQWDEYVRRRDAARRFAIDNDLRGTFATLQRRRIKIPGHRT